MFLSKNAHPHRLAPTSYSDAGAFGDEMERVFAASWNVVAATSDLASEGAQLATEVGGIPVVIRNERGVLRAFRNVCPHRHSLIAKPGLGCAQILKCQYHGWEFGSDGALSHLPDGRSFRGFKAKDARLEPMRCESAFGLVFVNPSLGDRGLRDDWSGVAAVLASHFDSLELRFVQVTEHDVNWKIIVENAVESYHVPMVHASTFGSYQDESLHGHVIEPAYTQYHDLASTAPPTSLWRVLDRVLFEQRRLYGYSHTHLFPNHLVTWAGFYREWVVVEPLGPRRSRRKAFGFMPKDVRGFIPFPKLLRYELTRRTRRSADRILGEDSSLWSSVQRGTEASRFAGVLSTREERVAAFHRYLIDRRG